MKQISEKVKQELAAAPNNETALVRYHNPSGVAEWYITSYDADTKLFHGYVTGLHDELNGWRDITEKELIDLDTPPLFIDRQQDLNFKPTPIDGIISDIENDKQLSR